MNATLLRYHRLIKQGLTDYKWFLFYLQRLTLKPGPRQFVATRLAHLLPRPPRRKVSAEIQQATRCLREDGLYMLPPLITDAALQDIRAYLGKCLCFDPRHPSEPGFSNPAEAHSSCFHAYYRKKDLVNLPHLWELANHPLVLGAIEGVLRCKPTISNLNVWWLLASFDRSCAENAYCQDSVKVLHRDVDDWAQIKLFMYLSDVATGAAPHVYLKGSHLGGIETGQKNLPLERARASCPDRLVTIHGKAGTAWLENTFGFHVGSLPETGNRLILSISYSLVPLPFGTASRRITAKSAEATYDRYINRLWLT